MARTNFDIIRGLMIADNTLDSQICETEAEEKRDLQQKKRMHIFRILWTYAKR